eukprot:6181895-Pleurochrysis_carterae.AAC.2
MPNAYKSPQAAVAAALKAWEESLMVTRMAQRKGAFVLKAKAFNQAHVRTVAKKGRSANHETPCEKAEAAAKPTQAAAEAEKENLNARNSRRVVSVYSGKCDIVHATRIAFVLARMHMLVQWKALLR